MPGVNHNRREEGHVGRMTVADRLCAALVEQGVTVMFGHPGGAILPFYDSLYRQAKLRHILMRHEQAVVQRHR